MKDDWLYSQIEWPKPCSLLFQYVHFFAKLMQQLFVEVNEQGWNLYIQHLSSWWYHYYIAPDIIGNIILRVVNYIVLYIINIFHEILITGMYLSYSLFTWHTPVLFSPIPHHISQCVSALPWGFPWVCFFSF